MEQRRNFLHPESAAGLQQARSVPPGCPWPGPAALPSIPKPSGGGGGGGGGGGSSTAQS